MGVCRTRRGSACPPTAGRPSNRASSRFPAARSISTWYERAVVLYWYQTPWQVTATELRTRVWVAVNGILHQRSDVVLVRLVAPGAGDRRKGLEAALRLAPLVMSEMRARLR